MKICNQVRLKVVGMVQIIILVDFQACPRGLVYLFSGMAFSGMTFRDFSTVFFIRLWFSDVSLSLIGSRPAD